MAPRFLPILEWSTRYDGRTFAADGLAAAIVTVMLIPQSLAYALLAGLQAQVAARPKVTDVVLQCCAINAIDASALESLELSLHRLTDADIRLHLSEVKGPVMDRLRRSSILDHLTGEVWLTQHQAMRRLGPGTAARGDRSRRSDRC